MERQGGTCPICVRGITWGSMHVDHDHECCPGETSCGRCVRGFLCPTCNVGLGSFQDSPELLVSAAVYMEGWTNAISRTCGP
jgi:hypothetical protein